MSTSSPATSIPTELLGEIFEWSTTLAPRLQPHHPLIAPLPKFDTTALVISQVSSTWRTIALTSPRLWTTMAVYNPSATALNLVNFYLSRAGSTELLALYLTEQDALKDYYFGLGPPRRPGDKEWRYTEAILRMWLKYTHRWQSIFFDFRGGPLPLALMSLDASVLTVPNLRDVAIHDGIVRAPQTKQLFNDLWNKLHTLPTLRTTYWEYGHTFSAPFFQLTAFTLRDTSLDKLCKILQQSERLENLTIEWLEVYPVHTDADLATTSTGAVTVPNLQILNLENLADTSLERTQALLKHLITPRLQELIIERIPALSLYPQSTLSDFLSQSKCSLRTLVLGKRCSEIQTLDILRFANENHLLDHLERLTMKGAFAQNVLDLFHVHRPGIPPTTSSRRGDFFPDIPFPSLLNLKIGFCRAPTDGRISEILIERAKAGAGIRLFECCVTSFDGQPYHLDHKKFKWIEDFGTECKVTYIKRLVSD
ncbi:hypothetical protein BDN72DRAFT_841556 [Pluteus cervinus]|uniref:Uncharacterized protein n=1 Tax=Pluteus cervinus TaxID=181527 RepID=A0ACD3ATD6_9AGAR|nr:hypothetical protein BDN72DRAFT_841556 [Pluteus cervinus]